MNQPLKIFVHLGYGQDAYGPREQYLAGRAPDEVPYGYHHAEKMGCVVEYSRDFRESRVANLFRRSLVVQVIHHHAGPLTATGQSDRLTNALLRTGH